MDKKDDVDVMDVLAGASRCPWVCMGHSVGTITSMNVWTPSLLLSSSSSSQQQLIMMGQATNTNAFDGSISDDCVARFTCRDYTIIGINELFMR